MTTSILRRVQQFMRRRWEHVKRYEPVRFWEERGKTYPEKLEDPNFKIVDVEHREVIGEMLNEIPIKSFIEVGCGSGRLLDLYLPFTFVVCIDMSSSMLHHARTAGRRLRLEHVDFLRGSATSLPLESDSFDCALTSEVLLHIPPRLISSAMKEISRVSRFSIFLEFYSSVYENPQRMREKRKQLASWNFLHDYPKLFEEANMRILKRIELRSTPQTCFLVASEPTV